VLAASNATAATARLRFLKTVDLPDAGLTVELMPGAAEMPRPPPTVHTYTVRHGAETWQEERFSPVDLWRHEQFAGQWRDEDGNKLLLAVAGRPLPTGFTHEHVTRDEYDAGARDTGGSAWSVDDLSTWAATYAGFTPAAATPVPRRPFRLAGLLRMLPPANDRLVAYLFRLNRRAAGQSRAPESWFLAVFELAAGHTRDDALAVIEDEFFGKLSVGRSRPPTGPEPSKSFQSTQFRNAAGRAADYEASRRSVREGIRNMRNWWYAETPNYILLSDLGTRHRVPLKKLQEQIEIVRGGFDALIPPQTDIGAVSVIRAFANAEEYERYVGPDYAWTSGVWVPSRKELVIRPAEWGRSAEQREYLFRIAYHEGFHQYLYYALDRLTASPWFNEGHAALFESADVSARRIAINESERHVATLQAMLKQGELPVMRVLFMSYADFYSGDDRSRSECYAVAWGIVYFLHKAAGIGHTGDYSAIVPAYLSALSELRDADSATRRAFADVEMPAFLADMQDFWSSRNLRGKAERNRLF
jgi:hypothetical protein